MNSQEFVIQIPTVSDIRIPTVHSFFLILPSGPASFIWETADGNSRHVETDKSVLWTKLGLDTSSQNKNPNVTTTQFEEPMDISFSLEDLQKAEGIDMSDIIQVDYNKDNESW